MRWAILYLIGAVATVMWMVYIGIKGRAARVPLVGDRDAQLGQMGMVVLWPIFLPITLLIVLLQMAEDAQDRKRFEELQKREE